MKSFTVEEVAKHNKADDLWIIISGKVYDCTKFAAEHPGGKGVLIGVAGKDATAKFNLFHKPEQTLAKYGPTLCIGTVGAAAAAAAPAAAAKTAVAKAPKGIQHVNAFGEFTPYGDPAWYQGWNSPYFNDAHRRFRAVIRKFVDEEISPFCHEWDEKKAVPRELYRKAYEAGWLPGVVGAPWIEKFYGSNLAGGIKPSEFDPFTELILVDELSRCGSGGVVWALFGGLAIGLPPIINFASPYLQDKVIGPCVRGEKVICLAITEPYAGSDVANLQCSAKKSACGKFYIVNGEKKWITNGVFADFFTVAVRTGGPGMGGISLLLIERSAGVTTKQMLCSGVWPSGTTYVSFEDVKVPVENLIGKENEGFKYVMYNFNHERWGVCVQATRLARVCFEEALKYSFKRSTFGKRLIEHPVIRLKLAHMARQIEATQSMVEYVTYQLATLNHKDQNDRLGGPIALLKAQSTTVFEFCAREAAQIFGGLAYTRGGQGEKVERLYREVRAYAIPAGSEEIMLDLGIRQALKGKL